MNKFSSLKSAIRALAEVVKDLFAKMPVLFLVVIYLIKLVIDAYISEGFSIVFLIAMMILFISICIYIKTDNIADTTLSFILGVLTIYSINWKNANYMLFIILYLVYIICIFYSYSIKLAMKQESILIQAAYKLSKDDYKDLFKRLKKISMKSTKYNQISIIDRCEIIKYLAFRQVIIGEYEEAIRVVELIQGISQVELMECCEIYYSMYLYCKNSDTGIVDVSKAVEKMIDKVTTLPITYVEFFDIFKGTKIILIDKILIFSQYINEIRLLAVKGYSSDDIVGILSDKFIDLES